MLVSLSRRTAVLTATLCGLAAIVAADRPSGQTSTPGGPLATVVFRATLGNGRPVTDLKPDDVVLRVGGRERPLRSLVLIDSGRTSAESTLPAPFASNSLQGRDVVLVVDEETVSPGSEQPLREALTATTSMLSPHDRVGVLSTRQGGANVALTSRHASVRSALVDLRGRAPVRETAIDLACRTRLTLGTLKNLFESLTGGPDTTVMLFSSAMAAPHAARVTRAGADAGCTLRPRDFDEVRTAIHQSGANVYVLYVVDPAAAVEPADRIAGLEQVAGMAGGQFVRLMGDPAREPKRILELTAAYYVASFEPDAQERSGSQPVDLRIRRDGVKAHARAQTSVGRPDRLATVSPRDMMRVATSYRDLPLRAAEYPSRSPGDSRIKLVVLFEASEPSAALSSAMVGLFDARGRMVTQWAAEPGDLARRPVVAAVVAPAGAYRLRVAAVDSTGRSGTLDDQIVADIAAEDPVKMSALLLGVPQEESLAPRLQFVAGDAAAVGYLEVYGAPRGSIVTASLELAGSEQGQAIETVPASVTRIEDADTWIVFGGFEIDALAPGDYVVRALVTVDGKPVGRVTRTLRKTSS